MCGIAGWYDLSGERACDARLLKAMTDAIRHRGPDGEGFHIAPGVGLGHRRLAIIDLSTGDQPMFNRAGTVSIVFNGEIYNYRELREQLKRLGRSFTTSSDTEVVIQAWEQWKEGCLERLRGMFAIALFDHTERTLFLARDRLGEKPLYFSVLPDRTLIFGSELKALLVAPGLPRRIDPCAVEEFFALGYIAEPRTIYRDVEKVPAGSYLLARRGEAPIVRQYWDAVPRPEAGTVEQLADSLLERLGAAVKSQLVSDVPVGAFLSGGADSSGTASLMAKAVAEPIHCFTIGFEDPQFDETRFAKIVATRYGARHEIEIATEHDLESVRLLPGIFDEPFGDSSALPTYLLARLARKYVTVALSGDAGDELFAGYRRYAFHGRESAFRRTIPETLRTPIFGLLGRLYPQLDWAPRPLRARQTFKELGASECEGYFYNVSVIDDVERTRLFAHDLRRSLGGYHASDVIRRYMDRAPSDDAIAIAQYVDLKTWLPGDILTKVDRAAMASSLETRVPMLDHDFVDWALGLPSSLKIANGSGKFLMKRAFEKLVPKEVLYRPKQGFSVPLARWFRGEFGRQFEQDLLAQPQWEFESYLDLSNIIRLLRQHRVGLRDHSRTLWLLWMFQSFLLYTHRSEALAKAA